MIEAMQLSCEVQIRRNDRCQSSLLGKGRKVKVYSFRTVLDTVSTFICIMNVSNKPIVEYPIKHLASMNRKLLKQGRLGLKLKIPRTSKELNVGLYQAQTMLKQVVTDYDQVNIYMSNCEQTNLTIFVQRIIDFMTKTKTTPCPNQSGPSTHSLQNKKPKSLFLEKYAKPWDIEKLKRTNQMCKEVDAMEQNIEQSKQTHQIKENIIKKPEIKNEKSISLIVKNEDVEMHRMKLLTKKAQIHPKMSTQYYSKFKSAIKNIQLSNAQVEINDEIKDVQENIIQKPKPSLFRRDNRKCNILYTIFIFSKLYLDRKICMLILKSETLHKIHYNAKKSKLF